MKGKQSLLLEYIASHIRHSMGKTRKGVKDGNNSLSSALDWEHFVQGLHKLERDILLFETGEKKIYIVRGDLSLWPKSVVMTPNFKIKSLKLSSQQNLNECYKLPKLRKLFICKYH